LGQALAQAGRLDEAIATLEKGERLFPFSQTLRKYLVLDYIRQKAYEKAKAGLERYVHDFPEDEFMRGLLDRAQRAHQP
jgi:outer membrane protein assembly factor BamD (BamD/ComL family)